MKDKEKDIDTMLEELAMTEERTDTEADLKALNKAIDRRIRVNAAKVVGVILLAVALIFACVSPVMNAVYPNPFKCDVPSLDVKDYDTDKDKETARFSELIRAFAELNIPYVYNQQVNEIEKKGFARYRIDLSANRAYGGSEAGDAITMNMSSGQITVDDPYMMVFGNCSRFKDFESTYDDKTEIKKEEKEAREYAISEISELDELPDHSILYLSVTDAEPQDILDLYKLDGDDDEDLTVWWASVMPDKVEDDWKYRGGIDVWQLDFSRKDNTILDRKDINNEIIKERHLYNLNVLLDNVDLLEKGDLNLYWDNFSAPVTEEGLKDAIKDVEGMDKLRTSKYCISGEKRTVMDYLKSRKILNLTVDDVDFSIWSN